MRVKKILPLYGATVRIRDRRDGVEGEDFCVVDPSESYLSVEDAIEEIYNVRGYDLIEILQGETREADIDLLGLFQETPPTPSENYSTAEEGKNP